MALDAGLKKVIETMQNDVSTTWTIIKLFEVYISHGGSHTQATMFNHVSAYFYDDITVIHIEGCETIVGFTQHISRTLKMVKSDSGCSYL